MIKILLIDNYDSFTYNLVQLVGRFNCKVITVRNDSISLDEISELNPDKIIISPGPGRPGEAGISKKIVRHFGSRIPILGVCLGHQVLGEVFGAEVIHAPYPMHGKRSLIDHDGQTIYKDLPQKFLAGRYHSLIIKKETLPAVLKISSCTEDGIIMGVRHKTHPLEGIQFHPESILTDKGDKLIQNWLAL